MGLVNETQFNTIEILGKKVNECIDGNKVISINIHTGFADIRDIVYPEHFKVYDNSVNIEAGHFVLKIENGLDDLTYNEDENSFIIQEGDVEIDIDF